MAYLVELTDFISRLSYTNLQLAQSVADYKTAEVKLYQQNQFLQQLIDTIPSPVYIKDKEGMFQGCNHAYELISRLSKKEIIGSTVFDFCEPGDATLFAEKDRELFEHPGIQVFEAKLRSCGFSGRDVIFNKATFIDMNGDVAGLIGVIVDITDSQTGGRNYPL